MLTLTEQEKAVILQQRQNEERKVRRQEAALNVLKTAHLFAAWMRQTGAGPSYSTFCDDFEYEAAEGEHRPATYHQVMDLINMAIEVTE